MAQVEAFAHEVRGAVKGAAQVHAVSGHVSDAQHFAEEGGGAVTARGPVSEVGVVVLGGVLALGIDAVEQGNERDRGIAPVVVHDLGAGAGEVQ